MWLLQEGATSETRKLVAILVGDVVEYSWLAGADEARRNCRAAVSRSERRRVVAQGNRFSAPSGSRAGSARAAAVIRESI